MTALCPRLHQPVNPFDHTRPRRRRDLHAPPRRPAPLLTSESAESLFLDALARASLCKKHARPLSHSSRPPHSSPPSRPPRFSTHARKSDQPYASALKLADDDYLADEDPETLPEPIPREELRALVEQYDYAGYLEELPPDRGGHGPESDESVTRSDYMPDREPEPAPGFLEQQRIDYLSVLLRDRNVPHSVLFKIYKALPKPRVAFLETDQIRKLMHRFSVTEFKDEPSMLRYLSIVDDMFAANIPMTRSEWNSAIHFAGTYTRKIGDAQVETATQIWLRMENEAGHKGSAATFNILFGIAIKAGKFALADAVVREMTRRGLEPNRYFRTNKIYASGLRRDGEAVRESYKELVDSGEIVDTVVLNCVMQSLINAGEASAAELIFERMKSLGGTSDNLHNIQGWRAQRQLGKVLDRAAHNLRNQPERRTALQEATPITPNLNTYRVFIKYHAHESGNIDRISELLDEMYHLGIPMHGSIFYQLLRGFRFHGGVRYSSWNKSKLDKLWSLFCLHVEKDKDIQQDREIMYEEDRGCYFDIGVVKSALMAYHKVTGKETTMKFWQEVKEVWKPNTQEEEAIDGELARMLA